MRVHLDVLAWLYVLSGAFGVLSGISLGVLASGTSAALSDSASSGFSSPTVWFLILFGSSLAFGGVLMIVVGRALLARKRPGRTAALLLAIPNLLIVPFGTALGVYAFWTLLNDEARREFGRPLRARGESAK